MTEKSPFESMTPESIKSEMLGRVINAGVDVDAREGSYANILLRRSMVLSTFSSRGPRAGGIWICTLRRSV